MRSRPAIAGAKTRQRCSGEGGGAVSGVVAGELAVLMDGGPFEQGLGMRQSDTPKTHRTEDVHNRFSGVRSEV